MDLTKKRINYSPFFLILIFITELSLKVVAVGELESDSKLLATVEV